MICYAVKALTILCLNTVNPIIQMECNDYKGIDICVDQSLDVGCISDTLYTSGELLVSEEQYIAETLNRECDE